MSLNVSRETAERLEAYQSLLVKWNAKINLIAPSTVDDIFARHIEDSLQLATYAKPITGVWSDLGSGGGLPGLVLAIHYSETPIEFVLVESDQRKATFLRTVIRETGIKNTKILTKRIETIDPLKAAYISARALAPLPLLMSYLNRHLAEDGQAWLLKGEHWETEVDEARKDWKFNLISTPSRTHKHGAILKIDGISHA